MVANDTQSSAHAPAGAVSNPLGAHRQTVTPVLKSSSRTSLTGMSSTSIDNLQKLVANSDSLSLRPTRRCSGAIPINRPSTFNNNSENAPRLPSPPQFRPMATRTTSMPTTLLSATKSLPGMRSMGGMPNLEDNLRKQTLQRRKSPESSPTEDVKSPVRRFSSFPAESVRRSSSAVLKDAQMQVARRSVSIVGASLNDSLSTSPPAGPTILEIRSQIVCRNLKQTGSCPFGTRCHYKHDGMLTGVNSFGGISAAQQKQQDASVDDALVDKQILEIRKEIPCRNFLAGCCTFGNRCFYKHCDASGKVVEETGVDSLSAMSLLRFPNPYGDGDICAAGVIPYVRDTESANANDEVWALFQVEDMLNEETGKWSAALAMFGGKVGVADQDWLHTAAREFSEETGGLVGDLKSGIPRKMAEFVAEDEDDAFRYTKYLEYSKFQVLYFPVTDASDVQLMRDLPAKYFDTFKGEVSKDWTRAATRLEPVLLVRDAEAGWKVMDATTRQPHTLPLKVPLAMALKAAEFPWQQQPSTKPASATTTQLEDLLGDLDSLLNISIKPAQVTTHRRRRSSSLQSKATSTLKALDESPHEAAYSVLRGSTEIPCMN